jgi:uncharacterized repeat protein (TIGR03803 family)
MLRKRLLSVFISAAGVLAMTLILASAALAGPKYKVLHAFGSGNDGGGLWGSLVFDTKGNLYGTTSGGGPYGYGTVFELTPGPNGRWSETVLHSFKNNDPDGDIPYSSPIFDVAGNLYGTATSGGGPGKYGTVFELTPGFGGWSLTVLHRFGRNIPAGSPRGGLVMDPVGNLYGTADNPFELSPSSGRWKLTLLHKFPSYKGDGNGAYGLIMDAAGNLYGITVHGGTSRACGDGCGTAYQLLRMPGGTWKESILHDFDTNNDDMAFPGGVLVLDSVGRLSGTAGGGPYAQGVVYRLTRGSDARWRAAIQYSFTGGANGDNPSGGVVMDKSGNLYGVTVYGGDPNCDCGVVYKLSPGANGKWKYTVLHRFTGYDGAQPYANLILDDKGNLYGTTATGGAGGAGVAFEVTP